MNNQRLWKVLFIVCLMLLIGTFFTEGFSGITSSFTAFRHKAYDGQKATLELYAMSLCPYAIQAESTLIRLSNELGDGMDFRIIFIGRTVGQSGLQSLHGQAEVDEDIRQLCVQKYSPEKLFAYLGCVNADVSNAEANWARCAGTNGIDIPTIKRCFSGTDGKRLLMGSFQASQKAGARESPTMRINNALYSGKTDYPSLKAELCKGLEKHANC